MFTLRSPQARRNKSNRNKFFRLGAAFLKPRQPGQRTFITKRTIRALSSIQNKFHYRSKQEMSKQRSLAPPQFKIGDLVVVGTGDDTYAQAEISASVYADGSWFYTLGCHEEPHKEEDIFSFEELNQLKFLINLEKEMEADIKKYNSLKRSKMEEPDDEEINEQRKTNFGMALEEKYNCKFRANPKFARFLKYPASDYNFDIEEARGEYKVKIIPQK